MLPMTQARFVGIDYNNLKDTPEYTVIYFPVYARAEHMRLMLAHAGADW